MPPQRRVVPLPRDSPEGKTNQRVPGLTSPGYSLNVGAPERFATPESSLAVPCERLPDAGVARMTGISFLHARRLRLLGPPPCGRGQAYTPCPGTSRRRHEAAIPISETAEPRSCKGRPSFDEDDQLTEGLWLAWGLRNGEKAGLERDVRERRRCPCIPPAFRGPAHGREPAPNDHPDRCGGVRCPVRFRKRAGKPRKRATSRSQHCCREVSERAALAPDADLAAAQPTVPPLHDQGVVEVQL